MTDVLGWCLQHFKHLDEANAAIHCAPVRYSPITFKLAKCVDADPFAFSAEINDESLSVLAHVGAYTPDPGR